MTHVADTDAPPKAGARSSGTRFSEGVIRQAGARWVAQALSWVSTIMVARLLSSDDYGLVAMALVFLGVAAMIAEFGLGATIVARQELSDQDIDQLHSLSALSGAGVFLFTCLAAPLIAAFFGEPRLTDVVRVMALGFVTSALAAVPMARARRELNYRLVSRAELLGALSTTGTVLALALNGARFWSLVIGNVAGSLAIAVAMRVVSPVRFARPVLRRLRGALAYARHIITQQIAYYGYVYADALVIGRFIGVAPLGNYRFAANITSLPGEKLVNVVSSVSLAYFARLSVDRKEMGKFFLLITEGLATLIFPILAGLALVAGDVIPVVFGVKWLPSVPLVQVTALGSIAQVMSVLLGQVLTSTMQAREASRYTLLTLLVLPLGYVTGALVSPSVLTIAVIWSVAQPLINALALRRVLATLVLRLADYLSALVPAATGTTIMALAVLTFQRTSSLGTPSAQRALATIAVGALVYVTVHLTVFRARNVRVLHALRAH